MQNNLTFTNGTDLRIGTIYGIGKNYSKHAREMGGEVPKDPVVFIKPAASYVEDGGKIIIPDISKSVHHEVELVVVISKECVNVKSEDAHEYIAGYAVGIDATLRDVQSKAKAAGLPWATAKGFVTSAPISKVVPAEAIGTKEPLFSLLLSINGELRQKGNTADMERSVGKLIEYLSEIFTLQSGDCIFTGTPEGVGQLNKGDNVRAELVDQVSLEIIIE